MTRDDIIRMAREAQEVSFGAGSNVWVLSTEGLERFVALIAAAEREACAKACDQLSWKLNDDITKAAFTMAADTIRARSK